MKKLLMLSIAVMLFATATNAQTDTTQPKHQAFVYAGTNFAPNQKETYSFEFGAWGMSSNTSFSATYDVEPIAGKAIMWVGAKAYWTVHSESKLCYMFYLAPKHCITGGQGTSTDLIEFGFNPNYTLSKNILFGITVGDQAFYNSQWNLFGSAGFVFLFDKHQKVRKSK